MEKEEVDRRGGKTTLKSGQGWTLLAQLGQLKTGLQAQLRQLIDRTRCKGFFVKSFCGA